MENTLRARQPECGCASTADIFTPVRKSRMSVRFADTIRDISFRFVWRRIPVLKLRTGERTAINSNEDEPAFIGYQGED